MEGCGKDRSNKPVGPAKHHETESLLGSDGLLTPKVFGDRYVARHRELAPELAVRRVDDLELAVTVDDDRPNRVYLDNAYTLYRNDPESLNDVIDRFVKSNIEVLRSGLDDAIDIARVVPVVKDTEYPVETALSMKRAGQEPPDLYVEKYNAALVVLYALDTGEAMRFLTGTDVTALGLTPEQLRKRAVENLKTVVPELRRGGDDGTYILMADGTYEASHILADGLWTKERFPVKGDLVVAIPSRDVLLITGSEDADGLKRIRGAAHEVAEQSAYRLSDELFVRREGKWVPLKP